ncbi:MAG: hypothetical protein KDA25_11365 [Phycisphaerales bacterium]|nr:hypothetical protein [Phycisphaerales bacterium]
MNGMMKALIGALIGGAIGAAVWAGISYGLRVEIGWLAVGVGALVGLLASIGAGTDAGSESGGVAVVVAVLSILVAKYVVVGMVLDDVGAGSVSGDWIAEIDQELRTPQGMIAVLADDLAGQWEDAGRVLEWPNGGSVDDAFEPEDYPTELWQAASDWWMAMSPEERSERRREERQVRLDVINNLDDYFDMGDLQWEGFKASFEFIDVIFLAVAGFAAFGLGSKTTVDL